MFFKLPSVIFNFNWFEYFFLFTKEVQLEIKKKNVHLFVYIFHECESMGGFTFNIVENRPNSIWNSLHSLMPLGKLLTHFSPQVQINSKAIEKIDIFDAM